MIMKKLIELDAHLAALIAHARLQEWDECDAENAAFSYATEKGYVPEDNPELLKADHAERLDWLELAAVNHLTKSGIIVATYTMPSYLACALINGDQTNLSDDEQEYLGDWLAEKTEEHGGLFHCVGVEDYGYCHTHDYDNMGANCGVFSFHVNEE